MSAKITASSDGTYGSLEVGTQPAAVFTAVGGLPFMKNILINGNMRINQRGVTIAAAANGAYGPDRWKKVDASNMTQIVEEFNYRPNTVYTLSGTGVTTQQITSPASGHWTLPNIPIAATNIQLEEGSIATPFELRPVGTELSLCQRYYEVITLMVGAYGVANTNLRQYPRFREVKRGVPSLTLGTITDASNIIGGTFGVDQASVEGFRAIAAINATGEAYGTQVAYASAEL